MIIVPDQKFNPNFVEEVDASLKLAPGVSISKFFGGSGNPCSMSTVPMYMKTTEGYDENRKQLARNLYLQAEMFRAINGKTDMFKDIRLVVVEGVYRGGPAEAHTADPNTFDNPDLASFFKEIQGDNVLKREGRLVVYKVIDDEGNVDLERTFDVAEYWANYMYYDKISLEYDKWDPSGKMNGQIGVYMPKVPESFDVSFGMELQSLYNGHGLSANELIECLEE